MTTAYRRPSDAHALAHNFRVFADADCTSEPLYAALSHAIANDDAILELLMQAPYRQRRPVLLFAAVHDLLLGGITHRLAAFYRSLTADAHHDPEVERAHAAFADFCAVHRDALLAIITTRGTQTNETGRAAGLALALLGLLASRPIALIDVGCSAGLNLFVDRYRFEYRSADHAAQTIGPAGASVVVPCLLEGDTTPWHEEAGTALPAISARVGIDLAPLDVRREDDARWLSACVWPSDTTRGERLKRALGEAQRDPPRLVAGDADTALPRVLDDLDFGLRPVVFHSWVLSYFDHAARVRFSERMFDLVATRNAIWISAESASVVPGLVTPALGPDASPARREATLWHMTSRGDDGKASSRVLARSHPHCTWIEWLATNTTA